jgi:hypothetical protein
MSAHDIRKYVVNVETILHEGGEPVVRPLRKGVSAVVLANPHAGRYVKDLVPWMESMRPLGIDLSNRLLAALQADKSEIQAFGKGAIVGVDGELEHAAAWHTPGGAGLKTVLGASGFVTAGQLMGTVAASLHIPLVYINSPWVRSHFDAIDLVISDAPRPKEIVFAVAMSTGGRVHARLGGLTMEQAAGAGPRT